MRIKVSEIKEAPGYIQKILEGVIISGDIQLDKVYELVEIDEQSDKQRKLFNPLVRLYYDSALYPYPARSWLELREKIKRYLGEGIETITYSGFNHEIITVKYADKDTIPRYIIEDYKEGNKQRMKENLKSMRDYTTKQMYNITNSLIYEMIQNEVLLSKQGKKFNEILGEIGFTE